MVSVEVKACCLIVKEGIKDKEENGLTAPLQIVTPRSVQFS